MTILAGQDGCDCWVSTRPEEEQFCLRYGAHGFECPVYRPSGDPVDARYDDQARNEGEAHARGPEDRRDR